MKWSAVVTLAATILCTLLIGQVHPQAAIALATDKQSYALGESVVFLGRGYDFPPDRSITFYIYVDEASANGHISNILYVNFTTGPPSWDFTIFWTPQKSGQYSAYVTGPDHTASAEVQFQVLDQIPVPEFPSASYALLFALVAGFAAVALSRSHLRGWVPVCSPVRQMNFTIQGVAIGIICVTFLGLSGVEAD